MSMLLTISQPTRSDVGYRNHPHDFSPRIPLAKSRLSPRATHRRVDSPVNSLRSSEAPSDRRMSTSHRGLPPPASLTLPDPRPTQASSIGSLPVPPNATFSPQEEQSRWYAYKAEEEKRRQEEARTRQEELKLEQRRIEASMLHEALHSGVPPSMVPMIYAGLSSHLANVNPAEWTQHFFAMHHALAQQAPMQHPSSPEVRREIRPVPVAPEYAPGLHPHHVLPSQHMEQAQPPLQLQTTFQTYPSVRATPTATPRSAHTQLPRLTTENIAPAPQSQQGPSSAHPLQQSQSVDQTTTSSPHLIFHQWQPPSDTKAGPSVPPQTPASKDEPHSAHPSHLSESGPRDSPRKRKAQGGHQYNPPPSAGPGHQSPSFSATSLSSSTRRSGGHIRSRSNASMSRDSDGRPDSRREADPPRSSYTAANNGRKSGEQERPSSPPSARPATREESSSRSSREAHRARSQQPAEPQRPGTS